MRECLTAETPNSHTPASHALPDLPEPGTRVILMFRGQPRHGAVQPYDVQWSRSVFPVRFDDGQWQLMSARDVTIERTQIP